jgi:RNA polymerase sigma-70 factor (ECF subfamily)
MTEPAAPGHPVTVALERAIPPAVDSSPAASRPSIEGLAVPAPPAQAQRDRASQDHFRSIYEEHVAFVWRNLRRLGVRDAEVDDCTQEVFVVAHRRFLEYQDRGHGPRAWLFQIVLRVASDARRHRRRHPEDPDGGDASSRTMVAPNQTECVARREDLTRLDAALASIDEGRRAVLILHEIEEMTAPEIAQVLGIPLNTVYSRLRVGRLELEQALSRPGGAR